MRKTRVRFEVVPVAVAEKVRELQESSAKRDGARKLAVEKSRRTPSAPQARSRKASVEGDGIEKAEEVETRRV